MKLLNLLLFILFLSSCSSVEKIEIPPNSCNSSETMELFKEKTKSVLSKLSLTSSNFFDFSKMEMVRCFGFDYPAGNGPTCAKKCRPYQLGKLTESSDAVEVVLANINSELMVVEVAWVPGAMAIPTNAPPKKLETNEPLSEKEDK